MTLPKPDHEIEVAIAVIADLMDLWRATPANRRPYLYRPALITLRMTVQQIEALQGNEQSRS